MLGAGIEAGAGAIGIKLEHALCAELLNERPAIGFLELATLSDRLEPLAVVLPLAAPMAVGLAGSPGLPIALTEASLGWAARNLEIAKARLGRPVLVENAGLRALRPGTIAEPAFLAELALIGGCGLALDLAGIHEASVASGLDPLAWLWPAPPRRLGAIRLEALETSPAAWRLYRRAAARFPAALLVVARDEPALAPHLAAVREAGRLRAGEAAIMPCPVAA